MREILFRGKRTSNGEWEYGDLWRHPYGKPDICIANPINDDGCMGGRTVDPETVGQFTGLTDKKGKRIFEGDIVDVEYDIQYVGVAAERIGLFVVVFDDGCFMKQKKDGGLFHFIPSDKCEVVGNIHDNPELMEGDA